MGKRMLTLTLELEDVVINRFEARCAAEGASFAKGVEAVITERVEGFESGSSYPPAATSPETEPPPTGSPSPSDPRPPEQPQHPPNAAGPHAGANSTAYGRKTGSMKNLTGEERE